MGVHPSRGVGATDRVGLLPRFKGTLIHDRWAPYWRYKAMRHAICNAHLLRDLAAAAATGEWREGTSPSRSRQDRTLDSRLIRPPHVGFWCLGACASEAPLRNVTHHVSVAVSPTEVRATMDETLVADATGLALPSPVLSASPAAPGTTPILTPSPRSR